MNSKCSVENIVEQEILNDSLIKQPADKCEIRSIVLHPNPCPLSH